MPERYTVPRPIRLDESCGSVVMERARGIPLDATMREQKRRRGASDRLTQPMRRAGEWLRAMQDATRISAVSAARSVLAEQTTAAIAHAEVGLRGSFRRHVIARVRDLRSRVEPRTFAACGHHGDYWPGNIFLDDACATAIDFEGYRIGLPLEDVAYFLIELELLLPRHASLVPPLRVAFVAGYGGIDDADALQLFTLTKALHLISRDAGAQHPLPIALWMRWTLHRILRGCL
jgi:Ser/Thr protein kinase RdoA (MazF antagonist)